MNKIITVFVVSLLFLGTMAAAETVGPTPACIPPNLSCPQCIVTCPEIPACPACNPTITCADNVAVLPGLWEVTIRGVKRCGTITVYPNGFTLSGQDGGEYYKYNEMGRAAKQVENCN
jgi:hypothetical protein